MMYVLYQDDLLTTNNLRVYDTDDGSIEGVSREDIVGYLREDPSFIQNAQLIDGDLHFIPIQENPLELPASNVRVEMEGEGITLTVMGEEKSYDLTDTTVLSGFDMTDTELYFYLYDTANGEGQRVVCKLG